MLGKPSLVCSPPSVQLRVWVSTKTTFLGGSPELFSPLKNCYKSALLFNSFLRRFLAFFFFFYPAQFKNQQMVKRKKAGREEEGGGDAPPFSLGSWPLKYLLLWKPWTTIFVSPAPWRKLCWLFHLLKLHSPLTKKPQINVWSPGSLGNLSVPSYNIVCKSGFSSYSRQEFWSATICYAIARSKIYIFHKRLEKTIFSSWNHRPLVKRE